MLALTIRQPWVWAILSSTKRVENRSWRPKHLGSFKVTIALHAGASYDSAGAEHLRERMEGVPDLAELRQQGQMGAVVGCFDTDGFVTSPGQLDADAAQWFVGPIGWKLANVHRCTPIPMRGYQSLWHLPRGTVLEGLSRCLLPRELGGGQEESDGD